MSTRMKALNRKFNIFTLGKVANFYFTVTLQLHLQFSMFTNLTINARKEN